MGTAEAGWVGKPLDEVVAHRIRDIRVAQARTMREVTLDVERVVKQTLSRQGGGRAYTRRGGVQHRASAPGEPPAVDTGQYRASWHSQVNFDGTEGTVGTTQERGPWLEFGTSRMAARPHARPAVERLLGSQPAAAFARRLERNLRGS